MKRWLRRYKKQVHVLDVNAAKEQKEELKEIRSNPPRIDPNNPKAPKSHPLPKRTPPKNPPKALASQVVADAHLSLAFAGKMTYSENWTARSILFGRAPESFGGSTADCSQYVASILHWHGVAIVDATDYTGTLLQKGKLLPGPKRGCVAIWGPGHGAHAAFITEKVGNDWMTVGFGHQGAPDRNLLSGMNEYFDSVKEPGVRFLEFTK